MQRKKVEKGRDAAIERLIDGDESFSQLDVLPVHAHGDDGRASDDSLRGEGARVSAPRCEVEGRRRGRTRLSETRRAPTPRNIQLAVRADMNLRSDSTATRKACRRRPSA